MTTRTQIVVSIGIIGVALAVVGLLSRRDGGTADPAVMEGHDHAAMAAAASGETLNPVRLDPQSERRIGVAYATVGLGEMTASITVPGIVSFDETRVVQVNPRIDGWVEELFVDFTGASVRAGQPLLALYSPMLVSAQEELLLAKRLVTEAVSDEQRARAQDLLESARRRLVYWDVPEAEIAGIEADGVPRRTVTLRSPASGVIVEKNVFQGSRITPGMDVFRIADLSRIWIEGEVFERDLSLVHVGLHADVSFEGFPGQVFAATVTYILPEFSAATRTGRIRLELANPGLRFKPGMYANVEFTVPVHRSGLHVPRTAVLQTGTRSIVFVRSADGLLVPREITVGLAAGDHIEVLAGLTEGEVVVAQAGFLIDAESNMGSALGGMQGMNMGPDTAMGAAPGMPEMNMGPDTASAMTRNPAAHNH